jgi:hypothetical protein
MVLVADTPAALLARMDDYEPPVVQKWIERAQS